MTERLFGDGTSPSFEKFLNRKCSCPLIENFRWKISIKNGLRPSPPPLPRQSLPPRGSRKAADNFCRRKFCKQNFMQTRGSRKAADNFCRRKFCKQNFMQTRGSRKAAVFKTAFRIRAAANRRICPAGPVSDPDSRFSCRGGKWKDNPL